MIESKIGERPVEITKKGDKISVVFHPMQKGVKHPNTKAIQNAIREAVQKQESVLIS